MQPNDLARLLGITSNSVRRWTAEFYKYLSPQASPPKGKPRIYGEHDQRVFHLIKAARDKNKPLETIHAQLESLWADNWQGLPDVPPEWRDYGDTVSTALATSKAYEFAQMAVLQRDLEDTRQRLEKSEEQVLELQNQIDALRSSQSGTEAEKHALELELRTARGEVETLRARLDAFTLAYGMGRGQPLPLAAIIAVSALAVAVLVIVLLVVVRLVL